MFKFAFYKMLLNYNQFIFKVSTKCFQTTTLTIFCLFIVALSVAEKAKHPLMLQKPALDALTLLYVEEELLQGNVFYNMFQLETLVNIMLLKYVEPNFLYL